MKQFILILLIFSPFFINAQDTGIQFEHNANWQAVQAKAKAENKFIFMDCFTTWCGPCKYMSSAIFPQQEVGDYMNDKYVSLKVQLDTTKNDNEYVKGWYSDAHNIAKQYQVQVFPTYLIFDAEGNIVHRFVGSSPVEEFLAHIKKSINPETQYYTLLRQYENGKKDETLLRNLAMAAQAAYDPENAAKISDEYVATQKDLYTEENLNFLKSFTTKSSDKGFDIMLKEADKVDAILGPGTSASVVHPVIMQEEVYSNFSREPGASPDWDKMKAGLSKKYPANAEEALAQGKVVWYQFARDWDQYQTAIVDYMNKYGDNITPGELNNYAWTVFQNCPDMKCVSQALEWSKRSFKDEQNPMYIDTYANILYKLGRKDEAITWEKKALELAPESEKKGYQDTIDKMKNNEKTWN